VDDISEILGIIKDLLQIAVLVLTACKLLKKDKREQPDNKSNRKSKRGR